MGSGLFGVTRVAADGEVSFDAANHGGAEWPNAAQQRPRATGAICTYNGHAGFGSIVIWRILPP
jgi:hypothetical protein